MTWSWPVGVAAVAGLVVATYRWLRVSQREHYIAGSCVTIARRWLLRRPLNALVAAVTLVATALAAALHLGWGLLAVAGAVVFPLPMPLRGSPPLRFTRRATTLAGIAGLVAAILGAGLSLLVGWPVALLVAAVLAPLTVDVAAAIAAPIERRILERHRRSAETRLRRIDPFVIAVTGSWGKTSTKNHIRDLLTGSAETVASPASWNNTAGLSRTVHEHLTDTTDVLVAEMGTYGPGEIRDMCSWVRPRVGVICAIGPMHLERMRTIETIVAAKAEILEGVETAVLWVDDPHLAQVADTTTVGRVVRVGTRGSRGDLNVEVEIVATEAEPDTDDLTGAGTGGAGTGGAARDAARLQVWAEGELIGSIPAAGGPHPGNLGCAVAAALAYGARPADLADRLGALTSTSHRASVGTSDNGVVVIDDTFNSNPVGAHAAVGRLASLAHGRRAVVTPGMVELGPVQDDENERFARAVVESGATLVVVGWTNRAALTRGGGDHTVAVADRDAARSWVRSNLGPGDGVLWENDLPDHYP